MVGRWNWVTAAFTVPVDGMVEALLRSPSFHAGVRRVHRVLDQRQNGPHPDEPLRPGEATEEQGVQRGGFIKYFFEEIGNQALGRPTDDLDGNAIEDRSNSAKSSRQQQQQPTTTGKWKRG
ncbi:hypothetical protein PG993_000065 [Apiospora rasikravindrae]|uniref:Uncharacterized protein n=1 Tax=Apiospora rasikravindrae TaxID=990691 RepID=A0ABR1U7F5_9PEZI